MIKVHRKTGTEGKLLSLIHSIHKNPTTKFILKSKGTAIYFQTKINNSERLTSYQTKMLPPFSSEGGRVGGREEGKKGGERI